METPELKTGIESAGTYNDQTFKDMHWEEITLSESEFHGCTFVRCTINESAFIQCRFSECTFQESELSVVELSGSIFSSVRFVDSKVIGLDWTQADWTTSKLEHPIDFIRCSINHSTFIGLRLRGIQIKDCAATNVDFREADLHQADFSGTDLSESLFSSTRISEADFRGATNYQIDPANNVLRQAKFSLPEALALLFNMDIVLED